MSTIISGSLAYDRIMVFPGYFEEHILPEKVHFLNVSFNVNGVVEKFGGTAGNIAYALALLGGKPLVVATMGRDYQPYFEWLKQNRITTDHISIIPGELTASAYIITDKADNQITGFNPGAMKHPTSFDFNGVDTKESLAIVAPGNLDDMKKYTAICRARGIPYIFDPGQSLPAWSKEELKGCMEGARILISNDYELELIMKKTALGRKNLLELAETIITTRGEHGSIILSPSGETVIPAVKPDKVVDPTGAGDAYRGGLISGLGQGRGIRESALMGAVCASFCVEVYGTQDYHFNPEEFKTRFERWQ